MKYFRQLIALLTTICWVSCSHQVESPTLCDEWPPIFPDYIGVTIPAQIAPMNFDIAQGIEYQRIDVIIKGGKNGELHVNAKHVEIPIKQWHKLLLANLNDSLQITVSIEQADGWKQYKPFAMYVSPHPIDYGIVYRRIPPGIVLNLEMHMV